MLSRSRSRPGLSSLAWPRASISMAVDSVSTMPDSAATRLAASSVPPVSRSSPVIPFPLGPGKLVVEDCWMPPVCRR